MAQIIVGDNPLNPKDFHVFDAPNGITLGEWERESPAGKGFPRICFANGFTDGNILLTAERADYRLQPSDVVVYVPVALNGGGGSNPLKVILAVALIAFAPQLAGFAGAALGTTAITTAMVAKFGAALLLSAFVQPKPVNPAGTGMDVKEASPTYSVSAQGNVARVNSPIPRVFGRHLIYPYYIAAPFVEIVGGKQYLTQIFLIGHGKYLPEEPNLEDSKLNSFAKVDWAFAYYDASGNVGFGLSYNGIGTAAWANEWHHRVVTSGEVSGQTLLGSNEAGYAWVGPFVVNKAGTEITAVQIDMVCPRGLYYANNDGSFSSKTVSWEFQAQRVTEGGAGTGDWIPISVNQTYTGTSRVGRMIPEHAGEPSYGELLPAVTVKLDTGVKGVSSVAYDYGYGEDRGNWTSAQGSSGAAAEIVSWYVQNFGGNDIIVATVRPLWRWTEFGESGGGMWAGGVAFTFAYSYTATVATPSLTAATNEVQQVTYTGQLPPGRWQVRGKRTDVKDTSTRAGHELRWAGLKGILRKSPKYRDMTLLYTRIEASDKVSAQSSRKVNCVVTSILPVRQNDGSWVELPTRNPVWAIAEVIRARYGANVQSEKYVDYPGLMTLAQGCDQRGDYFDFVADQRVTVWEALSQIGRSFRATPSRVAGKVYMVRDQARPYPVAVFSDNQIRKGSFTVERLMPGTRASAWIEAEYFAADTWDWRKVLVGIKPPDPQATPLQVRLDGVTNVTQATREAVYLSRVNRERRTFVTFSTEMDGALVTYGDLIVVSHNFPDWGQTTYLVSVAGNNITVSNNLDWTGVTSFLLAFRLKDGSLSDTFTATRNGADNSLTLSGGTVPAGLPTYGTATEPTTVLVGEASSWTRNALVTSVRPRGTDNLTITAVVDNGAVYDDRPWSPSLPLGAGTYTVPPGVRRIEVTAGGAVKGEPAQTVVYEPHPSDPGGPSICQARYDNLLWDGGAEETIWYQTNAENPLEPSAMPLDYWTWEGGSYTGFTATFDVTPGQQIQYYVGKGGTGETPPNLPSACSNSGLQPKRGRDGKDGWLRVRVLPNG